MKKNRQLVILLAALLVLIFLSSCAAGNNASMTPAATDFAYAEDFPTRAMPLPKSRRQKRQWQTNTKQKSAVQWVK